ncbi:MAG: hypothetical protein AAF717_00175 [Bacteroidota bacterium]
MIKLDLKRITVRPDRSYSGKYLGVQKSGAFVFNFNSSEHLKLSTEVKAVFFQDQDNKADWYVGFGKDGDYPLFKKDESKGRMSYSFCNSALRDRFLESYGLEKKTFRLLVADNPTIVEEKELYKVERVV